MTFFVFYSRFPRLGRSSSPHNHSNRALRAPKPCATAKNKNCKAELADQNNSAQNIKIEINQQNLREAEAESAINKTGTRETRNAEIKQCSSTIGNAGMHERHANRSQPDGGRQHFEALAIRAAKRRVFGLEQRKQRVPCNTTHLSR
jgi:hypothetical protein